MQHKRLLAPVSGKQQLRWQQPDLHKNAIRKPHPAIAINLLRVFGFIIPLCLLGSRLYGFTGLVAGLAIGNLCSGAHAHLTTHSQLHKA